jgi:2-dehydro-3-deoxyphosphogluconate aldolase / (4S)-4-hydroxy-2-oxoglutarate aldolase
MGAEMNSRFEPAMLDRIERCGVIAVVVIDHVDHGIPLAKSLLDGGIDVMELTLRTPVAMEVLQRIRGAVPEMMAGIGTILTGEQVRSVAAAGAHFGVAPGLNPRVVQAAEQQGLPFAPGIVTPSDIETALELGCRELKFFPAEPSGGLAYLKSMAAPYAHHGVRYLPLGGLSENHLAAYLAEPLVLAVGGSWLAPRDLIAAEDWPEITRRAQTAASLARQARGE